MNAATISPPTQPVDPAAQWLRLVARERRTFRDFCRSTGEDQWVAAYQVWNDAHQQMMEQPAPNDAALFHKIQTLFLLSDMQTGQGPSGLSAVCADLWRMADLDRRVATAADWIELFECIGGRWSVGHDGVAFFVQLPGSTDSDLMLARRLEEQLHTDAALHQQVTALILDGRE